MTSFVILGAENRSGLQRTSRILARVIAAGGHDVWVHKFDADPGAQHYDCVVFLERIVSQWMSRADMTVLVPNQEWFDNEHHILDGIDAVWCKTRYAEVLFREYHHDVRYIGFTSYDRRDLTVERDYRSFLHVAGRSQQKGTAAVLEAWRRHPEWPPLTITRHPETPIRVAADNIRPVSAYLEDTDLRWHQNRHGIHLCPSEAEGFGHSLVEAMSCAAVVLTTDGPPMNELVTHARGVLVPAQRTGQQGLGTNSYVHADDLERAVEAVLATSVTRLRSLGTHARSWYEANDRSFHSHMAIAIESLVSQAATQPKPREQNREPRLGGDIWRHRDPDQGRQGSG